jgi:hypothetical protein
MSDYLNIKSAIISKLQSISEIKNVYAWEKGELEGYPSAVISGFKIETNEWSDTATNIRDWVFNIKIYQEIEKEGRGAETGEEILDSITDSIIDTFDKDRHLSSVADIIGVWVVAGNSWVDRELNMRVLNLEIKVRKPFEII